MIPGADNETLYKGTRQELGVMENGQFTRSSALSQYQSINLYSNYMFSLADKHNFTVMAGYQEENYAYSYLYESVTDMISTNNPGLNLGTGENPRQILETDGLPEDFSDVLTMIMTDAIY